MNTKDKCDCKYCKDLFIEKAISVQKPDVTKKLNDTIQNGIISRDECMYPEDYQKEILDSCWDTSQRWAKAVDHLIDDNLQIPGKTIKKFLMMKIEPFMKDISEIKHWRIFLFQGRLLVIWLPNVMVVENLPAM